MKPIGPLMWEHRLIEKMLRIVDERSRKMKIDLQADPVFIDTVVDFIRTYADRTHHGKEEDILFRELAGKRLAPEHARIMDELMAEHVYARKTVGALVVAKEQHVRTKGQDTITELVNLLTELTSFYPRHIEKEDKHFFYPCLKYFTDDEQQALLQEFWDFDRKMIHEKYGKVVEYLEKMA